MVRNVFGSPLPSGILTHILGDKFKKSARASVAGAELTPVLVKSLLKHIVQQKFEQRAATGDVYDEFIAFLSGEQELLMEVSF